MSLDENGGQRWVGEVNATLRRILEELESARDWREEHDRRDAAMFSKMEAHLSWSARAEGDISRRLGELAAVDAEQWTSINELKRAVYKGVGIGAVVGTLVGTFGVWFLGKVGL